MFDLLSIGDTKRDTFIAIPNASVLCRTQQPTCELCIANGKKIPVSSIEHQVAGSAPNVAIGIHKLNYKTAVLSTMGYDDVYHNARIFLKKSGVSCASLYGMKGKNSSTATVLNYQGESTQLVAHTSIPFVVPRRFPKARYIHLSELGTVYDMLFTRILQEKQKQHFFLSYNPGSIQIEERSLHFYELLQETDLLFVNTLEARIICNDMKAESKTLLALLMQKTRGMIVMTDGAQGAYATDRRMTYRAPIFPAERIEATGAGDAFATGVLGALMHKHNLSDALAWGSVNAASVIQYIGPTHGLLTAQNIQRALQESKDYTILPI